MSAYTMTKRMQARVERAFKAAEVRERKPLTIHEVVSTGTNSRRSLNMGGHRGSTR